MRRSSQSTATHCKSLCKTRLSAKMTRNGGLINTNLQRGQYAEENKVCLTQRKYNLEIIRTLKTEAKPEATKQGNLCVPLQHHPTPPGPPGPGQGLIPGALHCTHGAGQAAGCISCELHKWHPGIKLSLTWPPRNRIKRSLGPPPSRHRNEVSRPEVSICTRNFFGGNPVCYHLRFQRVSANTQGVQKTGMFYAALISMQTPRLYCCGKGNVWETN